MKDLENPSIVKSVFFLFLIFFSFSAYSQITIEGPSIVNLGEKVSYTVKGTNAESYFTYWDYNNDYLQSANAQGDSNLKQTFIADNSGGYINLDFYPKTTIKLIKNYPTGEPSKVIAQKEVTIKYPVFPVEGETTLLPGEIYQFKLKIPDYVYNAYCNSMTGGIFEKVDVDIKSKTVTVKVRSEVLSNDATIDILAVNKFYKRIGTCSIKIKIAGITKIGYFIDVPNYINMGNSQKMYVGCGTGGSVGAVDGVVDGESVKVTINDASCGYIEMLNDPDDITWGGKSFMFRSNHKSSANEVTITAIGKAYFWNREKSIFEKKLFKAETKINLVPIKINMPFQPVVGRTYEVGFNFLPKGAKVKWEFKNNVTVVENWGDWGHPTVKLYMKSAGWCSYNCTITRGNEILWQTNNFLSGFNIHQTAPRSATSFGLNDEVKKQSIKIYNLQGRVVFAQKDIASDFNIRSTNLNSGLYIIEKFDGTERTTEKVQLVR